MRLRMVEYARTQAVAAATRHGGLARSPSKELQAEQPGALVQVDSMHLTPLPGVEWCQFTALDVASRDRVVGVRSRATAGKVRDFLTDLVARMPVAVRAVQVDGGSVFMAEFKTACQDQFIALSVLPTRSPKLNGHVERANGTYRREFGDCSAGDLALPPLQVALRKWEAEEKEARPHQALRDLTPAAYLAPRHQTHL